MRSYERVLSSSLQQLWAPHGLNDNLEFILIDPSAVDSDRHNDYAHSCLYWQDQFNLFQDSLERLAPRNFSKEIKMAFGGLDCYPNYSDSEWRFGDFPDYSDPEEEFGDSA